MSDLANALTERISQLKGQKCNQVTQLLKKWGGGEDGSMVDGLLRLVKVMDDDSNRAIMTTKIQYGVGGVLVTSAVFGTCICIKRLHSYYLQKKLHEKECQDLINACDEELSLIDYENTDDFDSELSIECQPQVAE